ncbi:MAG: protoglobin domain-containing protein [Myxococcota bacterium]
MNSKDDIQARLAFLELGEEDFETLGRLKPVLEKHADGFVAAFYRHLLSFEATHRLLADPDVKKRLLGKQRDYLLSLADSPIDDAYFQSRRAIGTTHVRVGLEPRWYLGAYALYQRLLVPVICEHFRANPVLAERIVVSLHKRLMLDAQLAMESYIDLREERLAYSNRELAAASRELGQRYELEHERLRETSARARAAEELASIATIIAGLAHEIGTPMGVIQGHAELLETSVTDERGRHRLRTIREQIERISEIIKTLLNMARPHEKEHVPVELTGVVRETLAFLSEKLRVHRIETRVDLPARAVLRGNHDKLQQLFINLVMNAIDAMPDGGRLSIAVAQSGAGKLEVCVSDTGHGMSPEVAARVFEPFFTTKPAGRGSGLGLIVAKGIVSDHGGTIQVESAAGRGTEFKLVLPAWETQSEASSNSGA